MDFGALPPEINSGRLYIGAGAAPMIAASAAWNGIGSELSTAASAYQSIVATLIADEWRGPASAAMAAAAGPYVAWMHATATAADHAAAQAMASAGAFEAAHAMTVPPPAVAANRAQLAALVATNFLGFNTPAIAATEALYGEMWTQDAAAMYGYAGSSAIAGRLDPLTAPAPTTSPTGPAAQAGSGLHDTQAGLSQLVSGLPYTVQGLAAPAAAGQFAGPDFSGLMNSVNNFMGVPVVSNAVNGAVNTAAWFAMNTIPTAVGLVHTLAGSAPAVVAVGMTSTGAAAGGLGGAMLAGATAPAAAAGAVPVAAGLGHASYLEGLSVPPSWSTATAAGGTAASMVGGGAAAGSPVTPVANLPGGLPPLASAKRDGAGPDPQRHGLKPLFIPKQVFG